MRPARLRMIDFAWLTKPRSHLAARSPANSRIAGLQCFLPRLKKNRNSSGSEGSALSHNQGSDLLGRSTPGQRRSRQLPKITTFGLEHASRLSFVHRSGRSNCFGYQRISGLIVFVQEAAVRDLLRSSTSGLLNCSFDKHEPDQSCLPMLRC
jgi:hypothetical protein